MAENSRDARTHYTLATVAVVAVVAALGGGVLYERGQVTDLKAAVTSLQTQLSDRSKFTALENQEKCAQRAATVFKDLGFSNPAQQRADYESHFSEHHNKCFIKIRTSGNDLSYTNVGLMDAFDLRDYGGVFTVLKNAPRATSCQINAPGQPKVTCHSEDEFEAGIRAFME